MTFNLNDVLKETSYDSILAFVALKMKILLDRIQKFTNGNTLLLQHMNVFLEKFYNDVKKWRTKNASDSLYLDKTLNQE